MAKKEEVKEEVKEERKVETARYEVKDYATQMRTAIIDSESEVEIDQADLLARIANDLEEIKRLL